MGARSIITSSFGRHAQLFLEIKIDMSHIEKGFQKISESHGVKQKDHALAQVSDVKNSFLVHSQLSLRLKDHRVNGRRGTIQNQRQKIF